MLFRGGPKTGSVDKIYIQTRNIVCTIYASFFWRSTNGLRVRTSGLDPDGREVWMPRETRYDPLYEGTYVEALAKGASERFFELARKYSVDLERFA